MDADRCRGDRLGRPRPYRGQAFLNRGRSRRSPLQVQNPIPLLGGVPPAGGGVVPLPRALCETTPPFGHPSKEGNFFR